MIRRDHYIKTVQAGTYKQRFAVLACTNVKRTVNGIERLECDAWTVLVADKGEMAYAVTTVRSGTYRDKDTVWQAVAKLVACGGMLDLWIMGAMECMASTKWYDAVDSGRLMVKADGWSGTAVIGNPPVIVTCRPRKGKGIIRLLCLGNIGIGTDRQLASVIKSGALQDAITDDIGTDASDRADSVAYAMIDYVAQFYTIAVRERLGSPRTTTAAQSLSAFRHRFMRHPILAHTNNVAHNIESASTYSGRAECFRMGFVRGPLYHYDVRSCYPTILKGAKIPCRLKSVIEGDANACVSAIKDGFACIAELSLSTGLPAYPMRRNGLVVWPIGTFRTVLSGPELTTALTLKPLPIVHRFATYETDTIFDSFISWATSFRRRCHDNGNGCGEHIAKLLTNCLWGRFAKRDIQWATYEDDYSYARWQHWYERSKESGRVEQWRCFGGLCQTLEDNGYNREAVPSITAYVNSAGRAYLWELMLAAGCINVMHVATDSLIVNGVGRARMIKHFGSEQAMNERLKMHAYYDSITIRGINHYDTFTKSVDAGIPKMAKRDDIGTASWTEIESVRGAMARGQCPTNRIVPAKRVSTVKYCHGIVLPCGRIEPFKMKGG